MAKERKRYELSFEQKLELFNRSYASTDMTVGPLDTYEIICMPGFPVVEEEPGQATLEIEVRFNPQVTDAESLACAFDLLLETAMSTPGILDEYGSVIPGEFFVKRKF